MNQPLPGLTHLLFATILIYHHKACFRCKRVYPVWPPVCPKIACVSMNHLKYNTDRLGGHYRLACSLVLGAAQEVTKHSVILSHLNIFYFEFENIML